MTSSKSNLIDEKIKHLKDVCREHGMRVTPQRIAIYTKVAESCEHPDADTVYQAVKDEMPNVSVDTVYRTLASLEELNLIFRVDNQLPKARFDADKTPHHHFLCTECNEVYDIFLEKGEEIVLPKNAQKFGKIKDVNIQVRGICNKCLKSKHK